jgi:hypothetical protein
MIALGMHLRQLPEVSRQPTPHVAQIVNEMVRAPHRMTRTEKLALLFVCMCVFPDIGMAMQSAQPELLRAKFGEYVNGILVPAVARFLNSAPVTGDAGDPTPIIDPGDMLGTPVIGMYVRPRENGTQHNMSADDGRLVVPVMDIEALVSHVAGYYPTVCGLYVPLARLAADTSTIVQRNATRLLV